LSSSPGAPKQSLMGQQRRERRFVISERSRAMISRVPPGPRRQECAYSCCTSGGCGAHGQLHAERRALTQRRLNPDAPAVHLDNLSRNRKTEPRAALGTRVRAVDLAELLEDPLAFFGRNAGSGIADTYCNSKWPFAAPPVMRTS